MTDGDVPDVDTYPLTPMQFGLVFESSIADVPGVNVEQVVCRFDDEAVDVTSLERAWRATQEHHDALRTTIDLEHPDGPVQHVHRRCELHVSTQDWSALDDAEQARALDDWLAADRARGVDPAEPGAGRVVLVALGPRRAAMVWSFHHALLDGRSFATVLEEVLARYDELSVDGDMAARPERPRFRDHVAAVTDSHGDAAAKAFFTGLLDGVVEPTPAPGASADDAAPVDRDVPQHLEVERRLDAHLVARLEARAARSDATVGTALLAAWAVLVARYCSTSDVVFGTTRAGRHHVEGAADMVGCLINTVPIRLRPDPTTSVDELLRAARAFQLEVRPHEHTALVDVRSWSEVPGDRSLLSTTVVFERELLDTRLRAATGRTDRRVTVHEQSSSPLMLAAYLDDGLVLRLEYDTSRYRPETVQAMSGHLAQLLGSLAESDADTAVGALEMLGDHERRRLVDDRNPTVPVDAGTERFVDRFEARVREHPGAVAVEDLDGSGSLTYGELDERANRLAHVLVQAGASQERPVAVCLHRSVDFVVSVLAVLKAGAAYLPLDPTYPVAALEHMLDDSGARLVLAQSRSVERIPNDARSTDAARRVLVVDDLTAALDDAPPSPPARSVSRDDDLAYVIYTSGTTGAPKGVMISERSLRAFCTAVARRYELVATDRVLQFSSLSFDVSVEELLPTLSVGATVVLRSEDMSASMRSLVEATDSAGLSVLNLPSAIWHALVDHLDTTGERLSTSVRLVVVGGERVSRSAFEVWSRLHPELRWLNGYGPTETTVTCTSFDPAGRYHVASGEELPIGRPLDNARAYVLDTTGSTLVPDGQPGELWIGGSGVALGYLGRPELTAERFRPDPFVEDPSARMYRTGDRARWSAHGQLEYLGRVDRQIKLRGYRIEPGEVERVLEQHPRVRQAFVALRPGPSGDPRLVAWVVADRTDVPVPADVLRWVSDRLPVHEVPAAVVVADELVRTPAGKVDVDALPEPPERGDGPSAQTGPSAAPADALEAELCDIFGEVLGRTAPTAVDASFFDLGGHSLLVVRLIGRIDAELGSRVTMSMLHGAPTPRSLARLLTRQDQLVEPEQSVEFDRVYLSTIQPHGDRAPLYGIHVLGANGAFFRPLAAHLGGDQPVFGLSATDPGEDTPTAVEEIAARYVDEIQQHRPDGPLSLAAVSLGGYVAFEVAQQLTAKGRDVRVLALFDSAGPGGRRTVTRSQRVAIHLRQLRAGGTTYARDSLRRLRARLGEATDTARVWVHRRLGGETPDDLWMHRFVLANTDAADRYVARPYSGPMVVFHAAEEVFDTPETIRDALGWACVAAGSIEVVEVPGRHMSMLEEPHVAELAAALRTAMDRRPFDDAAHTRG